ncbi:monocarboxylate transporter 2-like [Diadema antillarum]|uniref:monocarboxylate transporter 2-like n=1 Tax=Diadema antillarum TaxID=105358 RepID=UPI003A8ABDD4
MAASVRSRRGVSRDRWRYLVLAGKGGGDFLNLGMQKAYGVLVPHLAALFGTKYGTIGFILSLATSLGFMTCPLVFALARRVNRRALAMTSSLLAGLAIMISAFVHSALWFGVAMVVVGIFGSPITQVGTETLQQYFGERFGSMNSLCMACSSVGGMILPLIVAHTLKSYGLEGTLLILGAIFLHTVPAAETFKTPPDVERTHRSFRRLTKNDRPANSVVFHQSSSESVDLAVPKNRGEQNSRYKSCLHAVIEEWPFIVLFLPCKFLIELALSGWSLFMVSCAVSKGLDETTSAYLPFAGAAGGLVNQALSALILHCKRESAAVLYVINCSLAGLGLILYSTGSSLAHLVTCSFFVGFGVFGSLPASFAVLDVYVSETNFPRMLSYFLFATGSGLLISGYVTGTVYDVTESFDTAFISIGVFAFVSALLTMLLMLVKRFR